MNKYIVILDSQKILAKYEYEITIGGYGKVKTENQLVMPYQVF